MKLNEADLFDGQRAIVQLFKLTEDKKCVLNFKTHLNKYIRETNGIGEYGSVSGEVRTASLKKLTDGDGSNLLHSACLYGNRQLCEYFIRDLKLGPHLFVLNQRKEPPLKQAIDSGSLEVLDLLFSECRPEIEALFDSLCLEGGLNNAKMVKKVTGQMPWRENFYDPTRASILTWGVMSGNLETVDILIDWISPESLTAMSSKTSNEIPPPLVIAASYPDEAAAIHIVSRLVNKCDSSLIAEAVDDTEAGCTCLHNAAEAGHEGLVRFLLSFKEGQALCSEVSSSGSPYQVALNQSIQSLLEPFTPKELRQSLPKQKPFVKAKPPPVSVTEDEYEEAQRLKAEGNKLFQSEAYDSAQEKYLEALRSLKCDGVNFVEYDDYPTRHLVSVLFSNLSFIALKQQKLKAQGFALLAIKFDPSWMKPYYRLGCYYKSIGDYEEACQQFHEARFRDQSNKELLALFKETLHAAQVEAKSRLNTS